MIKKSFTKVLLRMLNSRWLNGSPCEYGFINNLDCFSTEFLKGYLKYEPDLSLKDVLGRATLSKGCWQKSTDGLKVIEGGEVRDADSYDVLELKRALNKR